MHRIDVADASETPADQPPAKLAPIAAGASPQRMRGPLPPTSHALNDPDAKPYFLWWTDTSTSEFRRNLNDPDPMRRAYWLGALLREANTRDVWLFTTPDIIRELWPQLLRHLGRSREMWAYLLDIDQPKWPPQDQNG